MKKFYLFYIISFGILINMFLFISSSVVEDNFPLKSYFVKLQARYDYYVFNRSITKDVLVGKNDFLFYWNESTRTNYSKNTNFSDVESEIWCKTLKVKTDFYSKKGILYFFIIAPDKHTIYDTYLPDKVKKLNYIGPAKKLIETCKSLGVTLIDTVSLLTDYENLTYYKYDSHWNHYGASKIAYELNKYFFNKNLKKSFIVNPDKLVFEPNHDLIRMIGLPELAEVVLSYKHDSNCTNLYDYAYNNRAMWPSYSADHSVKFSKCNYASGKAVIFQDSFGPYLQPFISSNFNFSYYIWDYPSFDLHNTIINEFKPDVVIEEKVERHLIPYFIDFEANITLLVGDWIASSNEIISISSKDKILYATNSSGGIARFHSVENDIYIPQWKLHGIINQNQIIFDDGSKWVKK